MAWIYLAESVESVWPFHHGSEQSPIVKTTDMHKPYSCPECQQENSKSRPSGMTLEQSWGKCCLPSILFSEDSPARTSVLQDLEKAWVESEAGFSTKLSGLQKKLIQRLSSSKTYQRLELEDFDRLSEHLPIWGMTVDGLVSLPQALEPHSMEKDGSYWPRPIANDSKGGFGYHRQKNGSIIEKISGIAYKWHRPQARDWKDGKNPKQYGRHSDAIGIQAHLNGHKGYLNPAFHMAMMGYDSGWNELNQVGMQWYRPKQGKHL